MSLTLKKFRELTKDWPEETIINTTIEFGNEWSIRGTINCIHMCPKEHTYANEQHISLACTTEEKLEGKELVVRDLVGKSEWSTRDGK